METIAPDVLVLSAQDDATADFLIPHLERAKLSWYRWDPGMLPRISQAGMHFKDGGWQHFEVIAAPTARIRLDQVGVIWLRRPTPVYAPRSAPTQDIRDFIDTECSWFFRGMWATVPVPWVNAPDAGRIASYKPVQLALAAKLGFSVPRTYVGNDPGEVARLYDECQGRLVAKSFHQTLVHMSDSQTRMLYTSPLSYGDIRDHEGIRACPGIWQEYVPKAVELRVTIVGDEVFAAEIHSQASELTQHDWRHYDFEHVPHRIHRLPSDVRWLCHQLVSELGLHFGAVDLVLTPEGQYTFLEINPFGQWAWIEELCELPIAAAHCHLFSRLADRSLRS